MPFELNLSASVYCETKLTHEWVLELLKLSSNVNECKPLVEARGGRGGGGGGAGQAGGVRGRAVQVDPIKPTLIPPGTKRLKLKYDNLPS